MSKRSSSGTFEGDWVVTDNWHLAGSDTEIIQNIELLRMKNDVAYEKDVLVIENRSYVLMKTSNGLEWIRGLDSVMAGIGE